MGPRTWLGALRWWRLLRSLGGAQAVADEGASLEQVVAVTACHGLITFNAGRPDNTPGVRALACDEAQGCHISRSVPAQDFLAWQQRQG